MKFQIDSNDLLKGKSMFMGLAMLWIIAFHYGFLVDSPVNFIIARGYLGVDIFIFLSSFSLCTSLKREPHYMPFIKRRLSRIIPMWWLLITFLLIVNILIGRNYPQNILQFICYYSGLGWWFFHNEPFGTYYYEWYIPTLLLFYFLVPLLYRMNKKNIIYLFVTSIVCIFILQYFKIEERMVGLSIVRIPVLIYGVILYKICNNEYDEQTSNRYITISSILGLGAFLLSIGGIIKFTLFGFMFALPFFLSVCIFVFRGLFNRILSFIGTITLELYLLHIYDLPLIPVQKIIDNKTIAIVVTTILLIGIAYLLQKTMRLVLNKAKL
jgi:peptidoglycan/LPS O-acetylase OafA/YrhL